MYRTKMEEKIGRAHEFLCSTLSLSKFKRLTDREIAIESRFGDDYWPKLREYMVLDGYIIAQKASSRRFEYKATTKLKSTCPMDLVEDFTRWKDLGIISGEGREMDTPTLFCKDMEQNEGDTGIVKRLDVLIEILRDALRELKNKSNNHA